MIYLAIALLAVLLTAAGIWRCDLLGNQSFPKAPEYTPPPPPPPKTITNHDEYMVIMGAEEAVETVVVEAVYRYQYVGSIGAPRTTIKVSLKPPTKTQAETIAELLVEARDR